MMDKFHYLYYRTITTQGYWLDPSSGTPSDFFVGPGAVGNGFGAILFYVLTRILIPLIGVICMLFVIVGGYYYMIAQGNEELAKRGKHIITNAIIGLAICLLAYAIIVLVTNTLVNNRIS
jgi:hypothetical protein